MIEQLPIRKIENVIGEKILDIKKLTSGYSRLVFNINDKYIMKVVTNPKKDAKTINEINFLSNNSFDFISNIVYSDFTKKDFPYIYYLEDKFDGESLLYKWQSLNKNEKEKVLDQLLDDLKLVHSANFLNLVSDDECLESLLREYDKYLNKIVDSDILPVFKINYLERLKSVIPKLLSNAKTGIIHGDLHFNNILINEENKVRLIDFEYLNNTYIEKEYDPIYRMSRDPNTFNSDTEIVLDKDSFIGIIDYIKNSDVEIDKNNFDDRLLLFDCLNSLRWLSKYPTHELYSDVLFNKSRKLIN